LPAGDYDIAIASGFVREVFEGNTLDSRGSSGDVNLVLAGNHYGTRVVNNHFLGAGETLRFTACPTEHPRHWGWSHAPMFDCLIEGNTFEDSARGVTICVEHNKYAKTSRGRVYLTATVKDNTCLLDLRLPGPARPLPDGPRPGRLQGRRGPGAGPRRPGPDRARQSRPGPAGDPTRPMRPGGGRAAQRPARRSAR
jgi:hypothetical protein